MKNSLYHICKVVLLLSLYPLYCNFALVAFKISLFVSHSFFEFLTFCFLGLCLNVAISSLVLQMLPDLLPPSLIFQHLFEINRPGSSFSIKMVSYS